MLQLVGEKRELGFAPRDHLQLGEELDLIDFETAGTVSAAEGVSWARALCGVEAWGPGGLAVQHVGRSLLMARGVRPAVARKLRM